MGKAKGTKSVLNKMRPGVEYDTEELHTDWRFLDRLVEEGVICKEYSCWSGDAIYSLPRRHTKRKGDRRKTERRKKLNS